MATLVTSDPPPRSTSSAASAIVEYVSTLATGPNASTSWTASAEASVKPTRIGVMNAPSGAAPTRAVRAHDVGSLGRPEQDAAAGGLERRDLPQHLVALLERDQRSHRDGVRVRVADHDPLVDLGPERLDEGVDRARPARSHGGSRCTSARPSS